MTIIKRLGFSVPTNLPGRSPTGMKNIVYKPEYDDPSLKKKKAPERRKKPVTRRKKTVPETHTTTATRPKKQLPPMKKQGWLW